MNTIVAIGCAALAACCYAAAIAREHSAVRSASSGLSVSARELVSVVRSRRWQTGALLGVAGWSLHVTALSLAPLVIIQPVGVLSLVITVLVGSRASGIAMAPLVRAAVVSVCAGLTGFVVVATSDGVSSVGTIRPGPAQAVAAGAFVLAAAGLIARGRARCLLLAGAAAVLFGTGSALIRAASQLIIQTGSVPAALGLATEAVLLMVAGAWWLHQAYASGPAAVVIAATTVVDPLSAVAVGIAFYGEASRTSLDHAAAQGACALLAVAGVIFLARSIPDPRPIDEEHDTPTPPELRRIAFPSHEEPLWCVLSRDTSRG